MKIQTGDIARFLDCDFPRERFPDGAVAATNRVGIFADERGLMSLRRKGLRQYVQLIPMSALQRLKNLEIRAPASDDFRDCIGAFFCTYQRSASYFEAGMRALYHGNMQPFIEGRLFPTRPDYFNDESYDEHWQLFASTLLPGDCIYTRDTKSTLSNFIAWSTGGTWSHVAVHVSDGVIWESVTSGIRSVSIEAYRNRSHWIASYRRCDLDAPSAEDMKNRVSNHPFKMGRYNYRRAILYGLKSFLGDHSHGLVPNSSIYHGNLVRISQV